MFSFLPVGTVELGEGEVEYLHFSVRSVPFSKVLFFSNEGASLSSLIFMVDIMESHHTDWLTLKCGNGEDNHIFFT
jgi:hypothetical protein